MCDQVWPLERKTFIMLLLSMTLSPWCSANVLYWNSLAGKRGWKSSACVCAHARTRTRTHRKDRRTLEALLRVPLRTSKAVIKQVITADWQWSYSGAREGNKANWLPPPLCETTEKNKSFPTVLPMPQTKLYLNNCSNYWLWSLCNISIHCFRFYPYVWVSIFDTIYYKQNSAYSLRVWFINSE